MEYLHQFTGNKYCSIIYFTANSQCYPCCLILTKKYGDGAAIKLPQEESGHNLTPRFNMAAVEFKLK